MRNIRPAVMLVLAIGMGMAAVAMAAAWLNSRESLLTTHVVVAKEDVQIGTRLQRHMLQVVDWPSANPLKNPLTTVDEAVDRVVNMPLVKGEPVSVAKLAAKGETGGLSAVLREGRRAVTVKVNEIVGVAGFALPGNYVDVMVNTPDHSNHLVSKIVIERIQVLAVAQDVATQESKPKVVNAVTLEVTPAQAEKIDLARSVGSLSLVLRSQVDMQSVTTAGARKNDLLQGGEGFDSAALPGGLTRMARAIKTSASTLASAAGRSSGPAASPPLPAVASKTEVIRGLNKTAE
jgi:pilus assembly protein CpaB